MVVAIEEKITEKSPLHLVWLGMQNYLIRFQ